MLDREKVIKGLECCSSDYSEYDCESDCPYKGKCSRDREGVSTEMIKDALTLLKAQRPRLLTLDEAKALPFGTDIWIEYLNIFNDTITYAATIRHNESSILALHPADVVYRWGDYGKAFVIWTGHPTEKQQKGVKWDD